jgi:hypothetical protein
MVLDLTEKNDSFKNKSDLPTKEYWEKRNKSIIRQVSAKCVAQVLQGSNPTEETVKMQFNTFLALIEG